jgi:hypothetical protein
MCRIQIWLEASVGGEESLARNGDGEPRQMKIEVERVVKGSDYIKATMEWSAAELPEVDPAEIVSTLVRGIRSSDAPSSPMAFKVSPAMLDKIGEILKEADGTGYQWDV